MVAAVIRLLTFFALMAMPLGMASASAPAQSVDHGKMAMSGHCNEQPDEDDAPVPAKMDCTAACAGLPPPAVAAVAAPAIPRAPRSIAGDAPFTAIILEIATPPPRPV